MFWRHVTANLWKIALFLFGLVVVFYVLIEFRLWSMDWTEYFLKVGNWEGFIFVSLIVAAVSIVLLRLFQWQVRAETRPGRR